MVDFFENGLCIHCHLAQKELMDYSCFNDETEKSWKNKDAKLQQELEEILKKYPEKSHDYIVDNYQWDLHLNQYKYPDLHRESLVISLYNFLENQLNRLCHIFSEGIESELKLKDLHGRGIERALLYLSKVVKVDLNTLSNELPFIKGLNQVRNIIVHSGGILPDDSNTKVHRFVVRTEHIFGDPGRSINIQPGFISYVIEMLISFFKSLDVEVQKHIQGYNA